MNNKLLEKQDIGELKESKIVLIDNIGNQYGILSICSGWNDMYIKYLVRDLLYKSCDNKEKDFFDRFSENISFMVEELRKIVTDIFANGYVNFEYNNCSVVNVDKLF